MNKVLSAAAADDRSSSSGTSVLKSIQAPPVKQRSTAASSSGSTLKAKVPPPVPPRGSPRKRDSDAYQQQEGGSSRALSTTPGIEYFNTINVKSLVNKFSTLPHKNTLQVPPHDSPLPRFGERRSPSNVRDWLELHDLFEGIPKSQPVSPPSPPPLKRTQKQTSLFQNETKKEPLKKIHQSSQESSRKSVVIPAPPPPPPPQIAAIQKLKLERKDSVVSTSSSNYSAARSRKSLSRPVNHVDLFQRQNNGLVSRRSSAASIVHNFPPIPSEHSERSNSSKFKTPQSRESREPRASKRREKRLQYMRYADMALGDDNAEPYEDNIIQSMHAFVEVKHELENSKHSRKQRVITVSQETEDENLHQGKKKSKANKSGDGVIVTNKVRTANKPEPRKKSKNVPSTISEGFASSYTLNTLNPLSNSRRSSFVEF